jgi:excisionase family DNA binding protein
MPLPELLDVTELGSVLFPYWDEARRRRWVYRAVEEKGLPAVRLGRSLLFDPDAVKDWLEQHSTTNGGSDAQEKDGPLADGPPEHR